MEVRNLNKNERKIVLYLHFFPLSAKIKGECIGYSLINNELETRDCHEFYSTRC